MKIAFVGKGGSGKSTLSTLFIRYLQSANRPVMAIDADLNMNLAGLLGVEIDPQTVLAAPANADHIRTYLKGKNPRIPSIDKFLPTTPPGSGSNIITRYDEPALACCMTAAGDRTSLLTVGTYDADGIGQTCYHSHLFVAENILSHTVTGNDFDVVCDMVAGTDAFAYTLHLQFDAIILIAEPTPESTAVCALFMNLARESGTAPLVHIIGNKIEDEEDIAFITSRIGAQPLGTLPYISALKKSRQRDEPLQAVPADALGLMQDIEHKARHPQIDEKLRFEKLCALHETLNGKQWVKLAYGDVMGQIDPAFRPAINKDQAA